MNEYITVKEFAKNACVTPNTVYNWIEKGLLESKKEMMGLRVKHLISVKELKSLLKKQRALAEKRGV